MTSHPLLRVLRLLGPSCDLFLYQRLFFMLPPPGFFGGSVCKETACNAGDPGSIPGLGRSPGQGNKGNGYPFQYSGLENSHGLCSPWGHKELDTTEQLSLSVEAPPFEDLLLIRLAHHLGLIALAHVTYFRTYCQRVPT